MTLPELHLAEWSPTKDTLHLYAQIVGKIRLATTAPRNHWWNAALYVDVRGLTTRRLHHRGTTFEIRLDFLDHALVVQTADGRSRAFELGNGMPVADFDARVHACSPSSASTSRSRSSRSGPDDDAVSAGHGARVVGSRGDRALRPHPRLVRLRVRGVQRLVQRQDEPGAPLLARPRPRGHALLGPTWRRARRRSRHAGGVLARGHLVRLLGRRRHGRRCHLLLLHAPEPEGLREQPLSAGGWIEYGAGSLAVLPYETVRSARDPRTTLLAFCQSAYEAGARLAGWDTGTFESKWCPTPGQLNQLHATAVAEFGRPSASS